MESKNDRPVSTTAPADEMTSENKDLKNEQIMRLENEILELKLDLELLKSDLAKLEAENKKLNIDSDSAANEIKTAHEELDSLNDLLVTKDKALHELSLEKDRLAEEINKIQLEHLESNNELTQKLDTARKEIESLKQLNGLNVNEYNQLKNKLDETVKKLNDTNDYYKDLVAQHKKLEAYRSVVDSENASLKEELADKAEEIFTLKNQIEPLKNKKVFKTREQPVQEEKVDQRFYERATSEPQSTALYVINEEFNDENNSVNDDNNSVEAEEKNDTNGNNDDASSHASSQEVVTTNSMYYNFYLNCINDENFKIKLLQIIASIVVIAAVLVIVACTVNMAALPSIAGVVASLTPAALNAVLYSAVAAAAVGLAVTVGGFAFYKGAKFPSCSLFGSSCASGSEYQQPGYLKAAEKAFDQGDIELVQVPQPMMVN